MRGVMFERLCDKGFKVLSAEGVELIGKSQREGLKGAVGWRAAYLGGGC